MEAAEKPKKTRNLKRSDNVIPDYDYLFAEDSVKGGKVKSRFLRKIVKMIPSSLEYILQAAPTWAMPLITADIINVATSAVNSAAGVTGEVWRRIIIDSAILAVLLVQNVPTTVWRWRITSKMLRSTSAGIKCSVIRKLQSLSITYHKDMQTGKIQSKFLKDTDSVDTLFNLIVQSVIPNIISVVISAAISVY